MEWIGNFVAFCLHFYPFVAGRLQDLNVPTFQAMRSRKPE